MLKQILLVVFIAFFVSVSLSHSAYAQAVAAPQIPTLPTNSRDVFPRLPPSKVCSKENLVGMWKLLMVYEVPSGREIELYTSKPLQYFIFQADNQSGQFISIIRNITLREIRDLVMFHPESVRQYSTNASGMLFFYKNSVAVDSLACFIVAADVPPFRNGQLLLMPPEKAAAGGRMLKIYEKAYLEFESVQ